MSAVLSPDAAEADAFRFDHPLDDGASATIRPLSRAGSLSRTAVNHVTIAPGKRAFPHHGHHTEEEWVYVLSGTGELRLGDARHPLGPGDFAAFAPCGPAHSVTNTGDEPLVCLMGGESLSSETVDFPDAGRRVTKSAAGVEAAPLDRFSPLDFFGRFPMPIGTE